MNKCKHYSCKNCIRYSYVSFKNNVRFCFGLVKKLNKPDDFYRFCIMKGKKRHAQEIMLEELYSMLQGLTMILAQKHFKDINKNHD